ncbi:MAG TPA: hypothetical protein VFG68_17195 [Fimbriiglobus sp.]|nr:hypothetical protein [Fimbriiglobus sp.]
MLTMVRDGNRAAIRSITTMECRYERIPWAGTTLDQARKHFFIPAAPGRFWRSGEVYRLIEPIDDGTIREYVVRNGRIQVVRKRGGPIPWSNLSINNPVPVDGVGGEIWQYLLFSHWGRNAPSYYPFWDIVQQPHTLRTVERLSSREIHVDLVHASGRLEFWFDPKVNYLVRKSVMVPAGDSSYRWEHEVVEFTEVRPAVFVPTTVEHHCSIGGELQTVVRTVLSELKVNHPMPKVALRIPGIAGMECIDLDRDVKFNVDADGNRVGPETPVKVAHHIALKPDDPDKRSRRPVEYYSSPLPSRTPTPWWVWVLAVSVCVLLAGVGLAVVRRRARAALD